MFKQTVILIAMVACLFSFCKKKETTTDSTAQTTTGTTTGSSTNCPTCTFPDTVWTPTGSGPRIIFKFKLDSTQVRLNNLGQPTVVATGNSAYSPRFNGISAHYIELAQGDLTQVGQGLKLYHAEETTCGTATAIVHCKGTVVKDGDIFFSAPITPTMAGTYKWCRISLSYQNYDIKVKTTSAGIIDGTIASFVGYNTYVTQYRMKGAVMTPTAGGGPGNHLQGYWGFYTNVFGVSYKADGQAPQTTVVNPNPSSPIPPGSCLVTGQFYSTLNSVNQPLVITGNETSDIIITISLSTNKSFEWKELTNDGYFQPEIGETPVDMGIRGMIPKF